MTTWNNVTIDAIVDPDTLPYVHAYGLQYREGVEIDGERLDFDIDEGEDWAPSGGHAPILRTADGNWARDEAGNWLYDEAKRIPDTQMTCSGESKYRRESIGEWAAEWTKQNLGIRVIWEQTWDDEEGGAEVLVYLDGDLVRSECRKNGMVPMDLEADVAAIRMLDHGTTQYRDAVNALLDALVPPRFTECEACGGRGHNVARGAEFDVASTDVECDVCGGKGQVRA